MITWFLIPIKLCYLTIILGEVVRSYGQMVITSSYETFFYGEWGDPKDKGSYVFPFEGIGESVRLYGKMVVGSSHETLFYG